MAVIHLYFNKQTGLSTNDGLSTSTPLNDFSDLQYITRDNTADYTLHFSAGTYTIVKFKTFFDSSYQNHTITIEGVGKGTIIKGGETNFLYTYKNTLIINRLILDQVNYTYNIIGSGPTDYKLIANYCVVLLYGAADYIVYYHTFNNCIIYRKNNSGTPTSIDMYTASLNNCYGNFTKSKSPALNNSFAGTSWDSDYYITDSSIDTSTVGLYTSGDYAWLDYVLANEIEINLLKNGKIPQTLTRQYSIVINIDEYGNMFTYSNSGTILPLGINTVMTQLFNGNANIATTYTIGNIESYSMICIETEDINGCRSSTTFRVSYIKTVYNTLNKFESMHSTGNIKYSFVNATTLRVDTVDNIVSIVSIYGIK